MLGSGSMLTVLLCSLEAWGTRILTAVEKQERLLSDLANSRSAVQHRPELNTSLSMIEGEDLEMLSRRDTPWTPITGSDMILSWSGFPREKPITTFPPAAYSEKPKLTINGMYSTTALLGAVTRLVV